MNAFIDGLALPFARFADLAKPVWTASASISYIKPDITYDVKLTGWVTNVVSERMRSQSFDKNYLLPLANELGLDLNKAAVLIALRNAWISYFQESVISKIAIDDIQLRMTNEIATEYVVLTSNKWSAHPWIQEQINQPQAVEHPTWSEDEWVARNIQYQAWREKQESDINFHINEFRSQKDRFTSFLEVDAYSAEHDIKRAKKKIQELQTEIEKQETVIREAMRPIRKLQNHERALKKRTPGRPKPSEEQQQRRDIATKFVAQWISSLMAFLSINSCGDLAKTVGGQKMTWWRWLNKETLPPVNYLQPFLNAEIKSGALRGTKMCDIHTTPSLIDLIALIDLI